MGDFDGDGAMDGDDFLTWQNSYGYLGEGVANPEPATLSMLVLVGPVLLRKRRV